VKCWHPDPRAKTILGVLGDDMPITEVPTLYRQLTRYDVLASLRYASTALDRPGPRGPGMS
jgi:uncharacterized protein (DUF433 family)